MLLSELIQRVQSLYSRGVQSDDSRLTSRHIYNKLITSRNRLVKAQLEQKKRTNRWSYQTLPCVEMIETNSHECGCLEQIGCGVLRSKYKIPKPLMGSKEMITEVTSIDGSIIFEKTDKTKSKYIKGNKYARKTHQYYIQGEYLYTSDRTGPRVLSITGLFEDPVDVENFKGYCDDRQDEEETQENCTSPLDIEFPIDADLVDQLIQLTIDELINLFSRIPDDKRNDSQEESAGR